MSRLENNHGTLGLNTHSLWVHLSCHQGQQVSIWHWYGAVCFLGCEGEKNSTTVMINVLRILYSEAELPKHFNSLETHNFFLQSPHFKPWQTALKFIKTQLLHECSIFSEPVSQGTTQNLGVVTGDPHHLFIGTFANRQIQIFEYFSVLWNSNCPSALAHPQVI